MISIQPKWCELIASGKKTVEVRTTRPKIDTPFKCYIYQTKKPWIYKLLEKLSLYQGKVIGEFVCDLIANYEAELWDDETYERIQEFYEPDDFAEYGEYEYKTIADNGDDFWRENMLCESSCLTIEELRKYVGTGIATFYGWHISDLVIYDKPKELSEFYTRCYSGCENCKYESWDYDLGGGKDIICIVSNKKPLKRPPQSWCYVERKEDEGK